MAEEQYWSPVAEYRGIAILEKAGDKRTVWHGHEYFTDGLTYVFWRAEDGVIGQFGLPNERVVKDLIDEVRDNPTLLDAENDLPLAGREYLDWRDAWEVVTKQPWKGETPKWYWGEKAGHFFRAEDRLKDVERWCHWPERR
jgi:hypothetical protein